jgi:hypothetical protein
MPKRYEVEMNSKLEASYNPFIYGFLQLTPIIFSEAEYVNFATGDAEKGTSYREVPFQTS